MREYEAEGPPPAWWKKAQDLYLEAMNESYRALGRAQPHSRPFILYSCKRLEFAYEYLESLMAVRRAGEAGRQGKDDERLAQLEKAVESMYNGLSALGEVARDTSDRGVIAVLAEYAYRPLAKELEERQKP